MHHQLGKRFTQNLKAVKPGSTTPHGFERGVYWSSFYENSKEFLSRKIPESALKMKPLFQGDVELILSWWKPKAIERYKRLKSEGRLNPKKLFYDSIREMDFETAKEKFLDDVGK